MSERRRLFQLARGMAEMAAGTLVATGLLSRLWPIVTVRGGLGAAAITLLCAGAIGLGWARWREAWPRP